MKLPADSLARAELFYAVLVLVMFVAAIIADLALQSTR